MRFALQHYDVVGDCWIWRGSRAGGNGYPQYHVANGKYLAVHREACRVQHGDGGSLHALHSCDTKTCINPAHLSWGTAGQNLRENRDRLHKLGNQRLNPEQAVAIKFRTSGSKEEVAAQYGISPHTVRDIDTGRTWADLTRSN